MNVSSVYGFVWAALVAAVLALASALPAAAPAAPAAPASGFAAGARYAEDHVLVKLRLGAGPAALRGERGIEPVFLTWYRVGVRPGETPDAAIARLRGVPGVQAAERDYYLRAFQNDPVFPQQWNFPMVQAQAAWTISIGTGVTVAVLDTGRSTLANDFVASHILTYPSPYGTTNDLNGHGTHVAGTIAQATNNNLGAAGLAHGANIRPVKVLSDAGTGLASHLAQGIYGSALAGDEVINMSLGGPCAAGWPACSTLIVNDAIKEAVDRDVVIVAASGNDNAPFVSFPANHPNVIAVGAVDSAQARAWYSNYGCALSLAAPGGTTSPNPAGGIFQQTLFNGTAQVRPFQGTSMAAPHVAAAAAILRSKYPAATALQVRAAIQTAALDLGAPGRDNLFGQGLLRINGALAALQAGPPPLAAADVCGNVRLVPNPPAPPNEVDLRVASINVANATVNPQSFQLGGTAAVTIVNWGDIAPNGSYRITLFRDSSQNGAFDPPGELLTNFTCSVPACVVAPFDSVTITVPLSGTLEFRDQRISAFVDAQGQIAESDETNNVGLSLGLCGTSTAVTVQPVLKWSRQLSTYELATPIVADLNQDGLPEVIVRDGTAIRALQGQTGLPAPFFVPPTLNASDPHLNLAVGNLDSDPFPEIIAMERYTGGPPNRHVIRAFEHDGTPKWSSPQILINLFHPISVWSPTIADLDHDGTPEVIAAGRILFGATGQVQVTLPTGPKLIGGAAIAVNLDSDPELEIVVGNLAFNRNGSAFWSNATPVGGYNAVADFNGDGAPDIIHTPHITPNTAVTSINVYSGSTGLPLAGWTSPSTAAHGLPGPPAIADVDGDGQPEVAVVGWNKLYVYSRTGSLHWSLPIVEPAGTPGISAFDFNQDGRWELVLNDSANLIIVADIGGAPAIVGSSPAANYTLYEYPVVADLDGDGHAEIVAQTSSNNQTWLRAYENAADNWPATRAIWNQLAYHSENVGPNGQIPTTLPADWWKDNQFLVNPQPAPAGAGPDLTAGQITASLTTLSAVIGNAGPLAAAPVPVTFYDGNPLSGGTAIGTATIAQLPAGQSITVSVPLPTGFSGAHDIHVVVDPSQSFLECDEGNNRHHLQATIQSVDLRLRKRVSPNPVLVGQPASYILEIQNPTGVGTLNTIVNDNLPAGIQVTGISYAPADCVWTSIQLGQQLRFSRLGLGIPANTTCTITVNFVTAQPGPVNNVAMLADSLDTKTANNLANADHHVIGPPPQPFHLEVRKGAFVLWGPILRGYDLIYLIRVKNVGTGPTSGAIWIVDRPDGNHGGLNLMNNGLEPYAFQVFGPWTCAIQPLQPLVNTLRCDRNSGAPPMLPNDEEWIVLRTRVHLQAGSSIRNTVNLTAPNDSSAADHESVVTDKVP